MISVAPSPKHPRGGYAELRVDGAALSGDTTEVAVFDRYSERYLGQKDWQATKAHFGPYAVARAGSEALIVIGPEIVNQIDEFANLRIEIGGIVGEVSWPDDIVPLPGAPGLGNIMPSGTVAEKTQSSLSAQMPVSAPEPEEDEDEIVVEEAQAPEEEALDSEDDGFDEDDDWDEDDEKKRSRKRLLKLMMLLIAALIGAAIAAWYFTEPEEPTIPLEPIIPVEPDEDEVVLPEPDTSCDFSTLSAINGFENQRGALAICGDKVSADDALTLLERGVAEEDALALRLFGMIYDDDATDPGLEDSIGLTFNDNPSRAAYFYARAKAAGDAEAVDQLARLCERMVQMNDTLTQGAIDDYCGS